jgi:large subunit ribosomal protein L29
MQASEIRTWTTDELEERLKETHREFFALRRDRVSGRLEDLNRIKALKRDIARMKTILRERELSAELIEGGETQ